MKKRAEIGPFSDLPTRMLGIPQPEFRFTPTYVGKTGWNTQYGHLSRVHPHARGEDLAQFSTVTAYAGSPPRMWGRLEL